MATQTKKAAVTTIKIGSLEFEGLMLPNGDYAIALAQAGDLFLGEHKRASQQLKRMMGEGFPVSKMTTELNSNKADVITLSQFQELVRVLASKGNMAAGRFIGDLFGLSLHQLWSDAFQQKFDAEDRQQFLKDREYHRGIYIKGYTTFLAKDGLRAEEFGPMVNSMKRAFGVPVKSVNEYTAYEMQKWNDCISTYGTIRELGVDHNTAIVKTINRINRIEGK